MWICSSCLSACTQPGPRGGLSGTSRRLAALARYRRALLYLLLGFSVPAAAVTIFRGVVSARKNHVPGGLSVRFANESNRVAPGNDTVHTQRRARLMK